MSDYILEVEHLKKDYFIRGGNRKNQQDYVNAIADISFSVERGKTLAVVGESGSGKTTLANTIMKFEEITGGRIFFNQKDITKIKPKEMKQYRRDVQIVFQDPASSLNPSKRIEQIIEEPLLIHGYGDKSARRKRVKELLSIVELPQSFAKRYPHMLSGGQKQRVGIARAIALNSELILLDEPTSALDVSVQAKIVSLLETIQKELNLTYFFITHDLALARNFAHDVIVMNKGKIVESGSVEAIFNDPQAAYTKKLLKAIPVVGPEDEAYIAAISL